MTNEQTTLLNLLSASLFGNNQLDVSNVRWEEVFNESCQQAVLPLAFCGLDITDNKFAESVRKKIEKVFAHNMRVEYDHVQIGEILPDIKYCILKGCASASYYPIPGYRQLGDVDLLIEQKDVYRVDAALRKNGFIPWNENHVCHIVYKQDIRHWEIHWEPSGIPCGEIGNKVREYLSDTIPTARYYECENGCMMVPDDFHHGLIILLHMAHHLTGEGLGLRHLCDWAVYADRVDVPKVLGNCLNDIGMWKFAKILTQLSVKYLGLRGQQWAMDDVDEDVLEELINDIIDGGNFGHKVPDRDKDGMLISCEGETGAGNRSLAQQFIVTMNDDIYLKWPVMKQCKLLLPFGWIALAARYFHRRMTGKREALDIKRMVLSAQSRMDIYKKLDIFKNG